ncbi:MAG: serine O-acetyltransferase [Candidatus Omnitrophica bacterium]|nr:serine O-acetyltransferase [Candidatus Omnitrophota bacterium]
MTFVNILLVPIILAVVYYIIVRVFFFGSIKAAIERDPSATSFAEIAFTYSGFHALFFYRITYALGKTKVPFFPRAISQFAKWITGIEIHPKAEIGKGFFIDHGMGVVIGETVVIGENVTLFQGVTLGGTGKEKGKRHPTLGNNVVVGAGAKVLGNIRVGNNVLIGANAVVLRDVPDDSTVVGVPGRVAKRRGQRIPGGINLNHSLLPDPLQQSLEKLQHEIDHIECDMEKYHEEK